MEISVYSEMTEMYVQFVRTILMPKMSEISEWTEISEMRYIATSQNFKRYIRLHRVNSCIAFGIIEIKGLLICS